MVWGNGWGNRRPCPGPRKLVDAFICGGGYLRLAARPIEGVSMAYTWDKANANASSRHTTQYFEMLGNRAIYNDGWVAATTPVTLPWELSSAPPPDVITGYKWELYNVKEDPTEFNDLAATMPDKLKQMQDLFYSEARKYDVLPLDNSTLARWNTPRRASRRDKRSSRIRAN